MFKLALDELLYWLLEVVKQGAKLFYNDRM